MKITDNDEFIKNSMATWTLMKTGTSSSVNAKIRANDKIVKNWVSKGICKELLLNFINSESEPVREALINSAGPVPYGAPT